MEPPVDAVVIASHKRTETLNTKTLRLLADRGVDPALIHVFVGAPELDDYKTALDPGLYGELHRGGTDLLRSQRNAIYRHYPEGARLVCCDDDVTDVRRRVNEKETVPVDDLPAMFARGFDECGRVGATLWGIYPVLNPLFMRDSLGVGLLFCIGHTFGVINTRAKWARSTLPCKEDYERTLLRYEHDGAVVRLNDIAARTRIGAKGGAAAASANRHARNREAVVAMTRRWPQWVTISKRRSKELGLEIRLRDPGPRPPATAR